MPNGSLDAHLFGKKCPLLPWNVRYKIVLGLASGLLYLHEEWQQCVVHRDIKSSNVMLDSSFNVKLGDFGLAKLMDHEVGPQTTGLAGTVGYMAPEYVSTGRASKESDVYSFGYDVKQVECLMIVGLWCVHPDKNLRPSIRQALQVLNFEAPMPNLPSSRPVPTYHHHVPNKPSVSCAEASITTSLHMGR
ncbi:L-type lectin-domain containing receptor kinase IX.1 [Senna tora]|uniref:L-type lectin-domain containing receptor kinase IX.1 n=1 Tax=Senna tora TaxID=362788 RepID=A0A834T4I4_9FABA|nr:L-type lectin-domain containing receptor kinase IX.1 [Senna tora]